MKLLSIDLFSGVGGLTEGMHKAGFHTKLAFEIDEIASKAYSLNHKRTKVVTKDIQKVTIAEVKKKLNGQTIHLLAGCPPCQGFSTLRTLNKRRPVRDDRNSLIKEYVRFVKALRPYTIMMENVPGLIHYSLFTNSIRALRKLGYSVDYKIVNVKDYGVPQSRKRLVVIGSRLGEIKISDPPKIKHRSVRDTIENMPVPSKSKDKLHRIFPSHSAEVMQRIKMTPKNGGGRKDLPKSFRLECHKDDNIGFNDIYGRLRWDDYSTTITGGCLNPSKGRFLHPVQNRTISAREAALLQSFPRKYKFPVDATRGQLALLIGNALPPKFSYYHSVFIKEHIKDHLG